MSPERPAHSALSRGPSKAGPTGTAPVGLGGLSPCKHFLNPNASWVLRENERKELCDCQLGWPSSVGTPFHYHLCPFTRSRPRTTASCLDVAEQGAPSW